MGGQIVRGNGTLTTSLTGRERMSVALYQLVDYMMVGDHNTFKHRTAACSNTATPPSLNVHHSRGEGVVMTPLPGRGSSSLPLVSSLLVHHFHTNSPFPH